MPTPHKVTLTSDNVFTIKAFAKTLDDLTNTSHFNAEMTFTLEVELTHYGQHYEGDQIILEAFLDDLGIVALFEPGTEDEPKKNPGNQVCPGRR